jgi:hypothetical protein
LITPWYEDLIEGPFVDVFREAMLEVDVAGGREIES